MGETSQSFLESYADCLNIAPFCVFFTALKWELLSEGVRPAMEGKVGGLFPSLHRPNVVVLNGLFFLSSFFGQIRERKWGVREIPLYLKFQTN